MLCCGIVGGQEAMMTCQIWLVDQSQEKIVMRVLDASCVCECVKGGVGMDGVDDPAHPSATMNCDPALHDSIIEV